MSSAMELGPKGDAWYYDRDSKTYDLTRGRHGGVAIATTQGPPDTAITISPDVTALIIVDMQNFFLDPKCGSHPTGLAAAERLPAVVSKCREIGVQVVWLNWGLQEHDLATMPAGVQRAFARSLIDSSYRPTRRGLGSDLGEGMGRTLMAGEWNSATWPPLAATMSPEDIHCDKNRMSGLWNSNQPLWKYLEKSGKRTLLFAGVQSDQCVLGTLTDAYSAGWDCVMIDDCCATNTQGAHDVCLRNVSTCYGFAVNSNSVVSGYKR